MKPAGWKGTDAVAARFSRVMNAATSRFGVLADPPLVALLTAVFVLGWLLARERMMAPALVTALGALSVAPIATAAIVWALLLGQRGSVVRWLDDLPFPVENLNAVLNGIGEALDVRFEKDPPSEKELNDALERVHPDAFVTATRADEKVVEVRIGVVDDKRLPARSNHARWVRVRRIVGEVLRELHSERAIAEVRVR